jgi:lambda family phage minor tail protein L
MARYLDAVNFPGGTNPYGTPDPTAEFPREIYYIDRKSAENRDVVEFELASAFDLAGVRAPKRQCISSVCQWKYRSAECGYTALNYFDANDNPVVNANQDVCGKRVSSCKVRFGANAELPFGSYAGVGTFFT